LERKIRDKNEHLRNGLRTKLVQTYGTVNKEISNSVTDLAKLLTLAQDFSQNVRAMNDDLKQMTEKLSELNKIKGVMIGATPNK